MRRILCLCINIALLSALGIGFCSAGNAASVTQPIASYMIQASWNDQAKTISGSEVVNYLNDSRDSLPELWMHLYMNGFRNTETTWMREARSGGGREQGQTIDPAKLGAIDITSLAIVNGPDLMASKEISETLMRVPLPQPLQPGQRIQFAIGFSVKMPQTIARTGYEDSYVFAGQWYPKMTVYYADPQGHGHWNNLQWHVNSEFFADFGTYDVSLNLPEALVAGATGILQSEKRNGDGTKTLAYHAEDVSDFAWTASPNFKQASRKVSDTQTGIAVDIELLYLPEDEAYTGQYLKAGEEALVNFSRWYGPYQHDRFTIVVPPAGSPSGGMEYPMLVTSDAPFLGGDPAASNPLIDNVTIHETGHQWIPMTLATNEMTEPWLDEGFTEYVTDRLMDQIYGHDRSFLDLPGVHLGAFSVERFSYLLDPTVTTIYGDSWSQLGYTIRAYNKPALVLRTLEGYLGSERMLQVLHTYWDRWKFRHPRTEDFIAVVNEVSGQDMSWFFDAFVYKKAILDYTLVSANTERQPDGSYRSHLRVSHTPDVSLPVDLRLTFSDGTVRNERWDAGQTLAELIYSSSSSLVKAELDPERMYAVELNKLDNSLTLQPQTAPAAGLSALWMAVLQALLRYAGYAG